MSEINRYNQGFHKFGPMEQCKNGKWVLASDYTEAMAHISECNGYLRGINLNLHDQISSLKTELSEETQVNVDSIKLLIKQDRAISILSISVIVLAVSSIAQALARILG